MQTNFEKAFGHSPKAFCNALYALCDVQTLQNKSLHLNDFIKIAQKYDAKIVQYRNKTGSLQAQKNDLLQLKNALNIPIIINDKIELIEYADGLHMGQEDLASIHTNASIAVKLIRAKIKEKLLGISTHNEVEILQANDLDVDMIGLGAYKNTATKDVSTVLGDKLPYLAKISKHPVCAIGGVQLHDKPEHVAFNVISSALYE